MGHAVAARRVGFGAILAVIILGCAAPQAQERPAGSAPQPAAAPGPRRLVMGIMAEPVALHRALIPPGYVVQAGDLADKVVNMGFTILDPDGVRRPMLAEAVPTIENGLWKLLTDGRME